MKRLWLWMKLASVHVRMRWLDVRYEVRLWILIARAAWDAYRRTKIKIVTGSVLDEWAACVGLERAKGETDELLRRRVIHQLDCSSRGTAVGT